MLSEEFADKLMELDTKWSRNVAVSAKPSSPLGQARPVMKMMEWSMHGVPWIVSNLVLLVVYDSDKSIQFLVNLFVGTLLF